VGAQIPITINIGGEISNSNILSFTIERDMYQPDMAAIVLSNQGNLYSPKIKVAQPIEVKVGDDQQTIYKGEVVGLEATFRGGEKARLLVRGMNKMHRLLRKRKSVTFMDKSDQQILNQVAGDAGLSLEWKHETSITYKHVYQHNLTDLEFIRMRAARMGCHVWCYDSTIYVKQPDLQSGPIASLKVSESGENALKMFNPRLSSSAILKKVTVKGWNPETKELITGVASAESSKLGSQNAVAGSGELGTEETFTVDHPIWSPDEAKALAKARLQDISLSYITGEAEVQGDAKYDLGKVVEILSNQEDTQGDEPFNGKYYIMGVTHRYAVPRNKEGGYTTIMRLARDAQKK
jgi:phage protein D